MPKQKNITIGIPCYNEELNVVRTYQTLKKITAGVQKYNFEFVFADNGSTDKTKQLIEQIASEDKSVKGVFLSRNFGPEASGQAVLDYATGDAFILYECDMQDPPELIAQFIRKWEQGYDIIVGIRDKIEDPLLIALMRKLFYKVFRAISYIDVPVNAGAFGLLDRKVVDAINTLPEKYRFFRGLRAWVGFKTAYIKYKRRRRKHGKSSYSLIDYIKHSERGIFGFSYLLLDILAYLGFILVFLSFLFIVIYLLFFFLFGNPIKGAVTILVAIVFFGGVQLLAISIVGKYIEVIVEETKRRPVYIVDKVVNLA